MDVIAMMVARLKEKKARHGKRTLATAQEAAKASAWLYTHEYLSLNQYKAVQLELMRVVSEDKKRS